MTGPERAYPMPPVEEDPRFTIGVALDVAAVLVDHTYPAVHGLDLVELQQALYGFLYVGGAR